ncbi:PASTA domain-containing protein [Nonomuraea sp. NPDC050404]|uniref:PASTA domain-containing protein n=1 Tax=Nonomuraea sp. NPDC050404 TaxID=3155783 RepID=UPI0033D1DB12
MTIEDDLADAMAAHVSGVRAAPDLGGAVRRRHRARVARFRAAGAALVTAAVAVAVPVTLNVAVPATPNVAGPATTPDAAMGDNRAVMRDDVIVPDMTGKDANEAAKELRDAGLTAVLLVSGQDGKDGDRPDGPVSRQEPAAGTVVAPGTQVKLVVTLTWAPTPQALGDLGDGREFGGIRLTYLPEGLEWGKWSDSNVIGKDKSYTTSYRKPGIERNAFSVQVIVAHGSSADRLYDFEFKPAAETVDIGGRPARLSRDGESGPAGVSTPTIIWKLRDDLAVEVCLSPDYAKEIDAIGELKKIAEGIRATK